MPHAAALCCLALLAGPAAAQDFPHLDLKNDKIKVKVYLPDAEKGFYRGTRFDHAGVFGEVEFAGHKVFGPWKEKHDPTNFDDIVGPCEEFGTGSPLGYDEAKVGETFLKIGVGELVKPKEDRYQFSRKYAVAKPLVWKNEVRSVDNGGPVAVRWTTSAAGPRGYGYEYEKSVELKAPATIVIGHRLKNTGTRPLTTDFYNHNFFNVDGDPVGPNYTIAFPFDLKANELRGKWGELVTTDDRELRFKGTLADGFVMAGLTGFDPKNEKHQTFEFRHTPSGVRLAVTHSYDFSRMNVWGVKTCICPEPFLQITDLKPGETKEWAITYEFTTSPAKK